MRVLCTMIISLYLRPIRRATYYGLKHIVQPFRNGVVLMMLLCRMIIISCLEPPLVPTFPVGVSKMLLSSILPATFYGIQVSGLKMAVRTGYVHFGKARNIAFIQS